MSKMYEYQKEFYENQKKFFENQKEFFEEQKKFFEDNSMMPFPPFGMPMMPFPMMPNMPGFKRGEEGSNQFMNIPKEVLQKILKIDSTPEDLKKLQKFLDFIFDLYGDKFN